MQALVLEAMRKAAVAWLEVGARAAYPVWCLWQDDALYVVTGPGEQDAPGLGTAATARVTARGDHGGAIVTWSALVSRLDPGSDDWEAVVPALAAKRLNAAPVAELAARWAVDGTVARLSPA